MRPHPRIRKTIKWGGAAVTVLLVVVWVGSAWYSAWYDNISNWVVGVFDGHLFIRVGGGTSTGYFDKSFGFDFDRSSDSSDWSLWQPVWFVDSIDQIVVRIPLWIPGLAAASLAATAWRLDTLASRRAARLNLCRKCKYDRAGLAADAVCPECGLRFTKE